MECQVVVVGDAKVGKTALIRRLTQNEFFENYTPTSFDKKITDLIVDNQRVSFVIWDTAGSSAYDSVRGLSYNEADVFLICYKVSDPSTLYNVKNKWIPEIKRQRSDVPVILCGCQNDLRRDPEVISSLGKRGRTPVSPEQALAVCCDVGASNYVETSSLTSEVIEAFEVAALAAMKHASKYNTSSSHSSINSKRFNTTSSKNSSVRLNVSFEGAAEISSGQIAQPQTMQPLPYETSEPDVFPPSSPVQRRSIVAQRSSFSASRPANLPTSPNGALIKSNGLSRRTSFRSPTSGNGGGNDSKNVPIPKVDVVLRQEPKEKTKAYESLKSHGSTGSTGSKTSTGSSSVMLELDEENVPNTEDPELLNHLNFVSPKAGVYRPVATPSSQNNKYKDKEKCSVM